MRVTASIVPLLMLSVTVSFGYVVYDVQPTSTFATDIAAVLSGEPDPNVTFFLNGTYTGCNETIFLDLLNLTFIGTNGSSLDCYDEGSSLFSCTVCAITIVNLQLLNLVGGQESPALLDGRNTTLTIQGSAVRMSGRRVTGEAAALVRAVNAEFYVTNCVFDNSALEIINGDQVTIVFSSVVISNFGFSVAPSTVFNLTNAAVTFDHVTQSNAYSSTSGAFMTAENITLSISNSTFSDNTVTGSTAYGGVFSVTGAEVSLNSSTFRSNSATRGGTFELIDVSLNANLCDFVDNTAAYLSGIYRGFGGAFTSTFGSFTFTSCNFKENYGYEHGGVIAMVDGNVSMVDCEASDNVAQESVGGVISIVRGSVDFLTSTFVGNAGAGGGVLNANEPGSVNVDNCLFSASRTTKFQNGASIRVICPQGLSGNLTVNNSLFEDGYSHQHGGAIVTNFWDVLIQNSLFMNNEAANAGGAILTENDDVSLENCFFFDNTAWASSGAVEFGYEARPSVSDCDFVQNIVRDPNNGIAGAVGLGWFVYLTSTRVNYVNNSAHWGGAVGCGGFVWTTHTAVDCVFAHNTATGSAGAIVCFSGSCGYDFTRCSFSDNSAVSEGGVVFFNGGVPSYSCIVRDSIFVRNSAGGLGGVFVHRDGIMTARDCTFEDNKAGRGAIAGSYESYGRRATINIQNASIRNCSGSAVSLSDANFFGTNISIVEGSWDVFFLTRSQVTLTNFTVALNTNNSTQAQYYWNKTSSFYLEDSSTLSLVNGTVEDNLAQMSVFCDPCAISSAISLVNVSLESEGGADISCPSVTGYPEECTSIEAWPCFDVEVDCPPFGLESPGVCSVSADLCGSLSTSSTYAVTAQPTSSTSEESSASPQSGICDTFTDCSSCVTVDSCGWCKESRTCSPSFFECLDGYDDGSCKNGGDPQTTAVVLGSLGGLVLVGGGAAGTFFLTRFFKKRSRQATVTQTASTYDAKAGVAQGIAVLTPSPVASSMGLVTSSPPSQMGAVGGTNETTMYGRPASTYSVGINMTTVVPPPPLGPPPLTQV